MYIILSPTLSLDLLKLITLVFQFCYVKPIFHYLIISVKFYILPNITSKLLICKLQHGRRVYYKNTREKMVNILNWEHQRYKSRLKWICRQSFKASANIGINWTPRRKKKTLEPTEKALRWILNCAENNKESLNWTLTTKQLTSFSYIILFNVYLQRLWMYRHQNEHLIKLVIHNQWICCFFLNYFI